MPSSDSSILHSGACDAGKLCHRAENLARIFFEAAAGSVPPAAASKNPKHRDMLTAFFSSTFKAIAGA